MKKLLFILVLSAAVFASCKKEDSTTTDDTTPVTPVDPLAANIALIAPGAEFYLIADVSGIPGVSKINWQLSTVPGSKTSAYSGLCSGNQYHTGYIVGHDVQPNYFWFVILFQTTGPDGFTNLVHTGNYSYCTPADVVNGVDISFMDSNSDEWRCQYLNNNTLSTSNFKVTKYEFVGGYQYLEAQFNCKLQKYTGESIILSNAVFKAHWI
ncbi:MAG: hypothetical protein WCQ95_00190 [Bacteroidota bacterium]